MNRRLAGVAVIAALFLTAGCGSANGSKNANQDGPIELYQLTDVQGPSTSLPFMKTSAEAAVKEINAAGGVNGRELKLTTCNEANDPNTAIKCAQAAAQGDKYVGLVGGFSLFGGQINPILEAAKLANIGPDAVTAEDTLSTSSFLMDTGVPGYAAMPAVAKKYLHASKIAVFLTDNNTAGHLEEFFKSGAQAAGGEIVQTIVVPVEATDYSGYLAKARDAGAEAIVSGMGQTQNLALWKTLASTNSDLKTVMSDGGVSTALIAEAGPKSVEGNYVVNGIPSTAPTNDTAKAYNEAMKKYAPEEKVIAGVGMRAWASVHLFAQVAEKIDGPITRESVLQAFQGLKDHKFMWVDSLSFDKPGPLKEYPRLVTPVAFPSKITNGGFEPLEFFNPFVSN
ncbi:ABC transporter substrate-binding protein [Specibacter sp. RAF43]|uniref:ABC transporter substrate-binding protein n=1 Tax=Specibacter sp. RAF43 TaxID=3233057 RepID=UPI003F9D7AAE